MKGALLKRALSLVIGAVSLSTYAQEDESMKVHNILDWQRGNFPKEKPNEIYQLRVNGFYRFFATNLNMPEPYTLVPGAVPALTNKRVLFIGDDTQLPNLWLNVSGRPSKKLSWGFDVFMFQFLNGNIQPVYSPPTPKENLPNVWNPLASPRLGQNMGLNLGINLYGSYVTDVGTFNLSMGGIHWLAISDLTLGSFTGYNRFMVYERNPWDPIGRDIGARYEQMYGEEDLKQDLRWGLRAVQGMILNGINLPNDWSFIGFYGKTELSGGIFTIPNRDFGGKLKKTFTSETSLSFNTLNNQTFLDSINTLSVGFNVHTLEFDTKWKGFKLHLEAGMGRYVTPDSIYPWGEAINAKITTPKRLTKIPIEIQYYRVSPYVINNNALFWNTSLPAAREISLEAAGGATQSANVLVPFASSVVAIGQMTNNRTGLNINSDFKIGKVNFSAGINMSREIEAFANTITFSHFVNQLIRSRFWRWNFTPNVGPYGRYDKVYRDAFQTVQLTDDSLGVAVNPKNFNTAEIHAKYRTKLGHRNLFAFVLGRYNTVSEDFSPFLVLDESAYLRNYSTEAELYYELADNLYINSYLGYERNLGGNNTQLDDITFRPLNQTGYGIGLGFDLGLGKNAGLYFRHRWFYFEDSSFVLDKFQGQETLVELKLFF